jgi:3-phenylpropionate/trans-cinnamate dioxygenase ferredoxin reductase subunit
MPHHKYLIIGGGMAADSAVRGIRSADPEGSIGIVCDEPDAPYDRPPLSKALWTGKPEDRIWRHTAELDAQLHLGRKALLLDREQRTVTDDRGAIYSYEKLLIATGLTPRTLKDAVPQVVYFRTYRDYKKLRQAPVKGRRIVVIGGGFIGSEMASSLTSAGARVTMLFPEDRICAPITLPEVGFRLNEAFRERGVDVRPGVEVHTVRRSGPSLLVSVGGEEPETLKVDAVVAGIGCDPNTAIAEAGGLEVNDGVVVDATLRTADPDIFAAGDVAAFWSTTLGRTLRVEHEDHANTSGMVAGQAMAGEDVTYDHLPFFYSDLFDQGYEMVGEIADDMEIVEDWIDPHAKGVVYYLRGGRVRGVALWNVPGRIEEARELIRGSDTFFQFDPAARIKVG